VAMAVDDPFEGDVGYWSRVMQIHVGQAGRRIPSVADRLSVGCSGSVRAIVFIFAQENALQMYVRVLHLEVPDVKIPHDTAN
jgi:hypothetical protein